MRIFRLLVFLISVLSGCAQAQETFGGKPYTFRVNTYNPKGRNYVALTNSVSGTSLPPYTNARLEEWADNLMAVEGPGRYNTGKGFKVHIDLIQKSTRQQINGMNVYRYRVRSAHAKALGFYFEQFYIPRGGSLFFYPADKSRIYGKLNHKNNPVGFREGIQMSTPPLQGNDWIIEYNVPSSKAQRSLVISLIVHTFR